MQTLSVENGFVTTFQQQKESDRKDDAVEDEENYGIKPRFFVLGSVYEDVRLLLHD
jgi:hypothetical protein